MKFSGFFSLLSTVLCSAYALRDGKDATSGQFPSIATVIRGAPICGGSIINARTILTTASCVSDISASRLKVRTGSLQSDSGGSVRQVSKVITHSSYRKGSAANDAAILLISSNIPIDGSKVKAATLASVLPEGSSVRYTIAGWGASSLDGPPQPTLRYTSTEPYGLLQCELQRLGLDVLSNRVFCTYNSSSGSCGIDRGGPVYDGSILTGLISDVGCRDEADIADLDVSVPSLLSWIASNKA
jgi:hypothetical protein